MNGTDGGLAHAPLMFVFLDISSLPRHRRLLEDVLRLRVIENQFHPPHDHHGLVKYDAGGTIIGINLFAERKFRKAVADGATLMCRTGLGPDELARLDDFGGRSGGLFTDVDGHHYGFEHAPPGDGGLTTEVDHLVLVVADLAESVAYYGSVLGLRLLDRDGTSARFGTGTIDLVLRQGTSAPDGRPLRYDACLPVFYTADVVAAEAELSARGLRTRGLGFSDIGGTARFTDPSGHVLCLYQPSAESLAWGSGQKVMELMTSAPRAHR
ncbi:MULTISPECIES: VOC family protein [Actinomadura]|uniref:VOC family protein n=1 Tax=Actinomadura yumaensis TaxID=111807 RepID=A0ABW2D040_9ACTN|nr:VOC family protein [Actinomadura sp. J1-007]MWK36970.1 hypothetical protein [Actinomadura sp. J1-007]